MDARMDGWMHAGPGPGGEELQRLLRACQARCVLVARGSLPYREAAPVRSAFLAPPRPRSAAAAEEEAVRAAQAALLVPLAAALAVVPQATQVHRHSNTYA